MWIGMLSFANLAMLGLGRRLRAQSARHIASMFTGGNLGMVLGMFAGAWCAARITTSPMTAAVALSFLGMTVGMLVGMCLGTWLTERSIAIARSVRILPRWLRGPAGSLSYEYRRMK
jgi:hypothetical protein